MTEQILNKIKTLAKKDPDIEVIWLYGSRARKTANKNSDYDLAVAFKSFIDEPLDKRLRPELLAIDWQQKLNKKISIIDINQAPIALVYTVIVDDFPVYVANAMRKLQEESRIMSMWELDYEYSRKKYA